MLDTLKPKKGWEIIRTRGRRLLPMVHPSVTQFSAGEIIIAGGGKNYVYTFNVGKKRLSAGKFRAAYKPECEWQSTVLYRRDNKKIAVTFDTKSRKVIEYSPFP